MEEKINLCINLLEIAKTYCDFNYDKTAEVPIIGSLLEIILNIQKELADDYDKSLMVK